MRSLSDNQVLESLTMVADTLKEIKIADIQSMSEQQKADFLIELLELKAKAETFAIEVQMKLAENGVKSTKNV